jgi:hypothetical protein
LRSLYQWRPIITQIQFRVAVYSLFNVHSHPTLYTCGPAAAEHHAQHHFASFSHHLLFQSEPPWFALNEAHRSSPAGGPLMITSEWYAVPSNRVVHPQFRVIPHGPKRFITVL